MVQMIILKAIKWLGFGEIIVTARAGRRQLLVCIELSKISHLLYNYCYLFS